MQRGARLISLAALATVILASCAAPPTERSPAGRGAEEESPRAPKRMVGAITGDPHTFTNKLNPGSNVPGIDILEQLLHSTLTRNNDRRETFALLAEQVPSLENGLWKTFPHGRMEVTWPHEIVAAKQISLGVEGPSG